MATVSGTFTAVGLSAVLDVPVINEDITISLTGTWVATVRLERELSPYSNAWEVIRSDTGNYSIIIQQIRKNERYRFNTVAFTSGTVTFSVSDGDKRIGTSLLTSDGREVLTYTQAGVQIPGALDVTGTLTPSGNTVIGGTLAVTGATTLASTTANDLTGGDSQLGIAGEAAAQGGSVRVRGGTSSTASNAGGTIVVTGGTPGATGTGGAVNITAGDGGSTSGAGGATTVAGGAGGNDSGTGGDVALDGGAGSGGNADGGNIVITPGALNGSGLDGSIRLVPLGTPVLTNIPAPTTATAAATLTAAQMLGGIIEATPAVAVTYTTLTGTLLSAALPGTVATGDSFELTIINLGAAGDIITMAGGTDVTFVGSLTIDDAGADINSSGLFRFRATGATTWIGYRVA